MSHSLKVAAAHIAHMIHLSQARSASDNSVNNPVYWVSWCLLLLAPLTVPLPSLACSAHVSAVRAPPVYCKPLQSLWLAWIVYSTTATLIAEQRLAPLCPSSIRRTGETGTACLRLS